MRSRFEMSGLKGFIAGIASLALAVTGCGSSNGSSSGKGGGGGAGTSGSAGTTGTAGSGGALGAAGTGGGPGTGGSVGGTGGSAGRRDGRARAHRGSLIRAAAVRRTPRQRSGGEGVRGERFGGAILRARLAQADHARIGGFARHQRVNRRVAATTPRSRLAFASNIFDRSCPALDAFADGAIANLHAVTDQQSILSSK